MKTLISGIQPTNKLTLGNYLGSIRKVVQVQDHYNTILFVADLHATTIPTHIQKTTFKNIEQVSLATVKLYLACGIKSTTTIFIQSHVREHLELFRIILSHSSLGQLSRMTQFKDVSKKLIEPNGTEPALMGLLTYPVLMASDILMYDASLVAVGDDQKQHLELTRDLVNSLNNKYLTNIFTSPWKLELTTSLLDKIMDLQQPTKKMSKTAGDENGTIFLLDSPEEIKRKILSAKTDSLNSINYSPNTQPGVSNLLNIICHLTQLTMVELLKSLQGKNYKDLKELTIKSITDVFVPIQNKFHSITDKEIQNTTNQGAKKCRELAQKKMNQIYNTL